MIVTLLISETVMLYRFTKENKIQRTSLCIMYNIRISNLLYDLVLLGFLNLAYILYQYVDN